MFLCLVILIIVPTLTSPGRCHADPILYERLIKRFHTVAEREAESKAKGYGRTLEADLLRGETKLSDLENQNGHNQSSESDDVKSELEASWELPTSNREQGRERWLDFLGERFVKGHDTDFDYSVVDENEDFDTISKREAEEAWFDEEEPSWTTEAEIAGVPDKSGETGIQDF